MGGLLIHIIPAMGIGVIIQIISHEVGHLIGGLCTGWSFLYIQIRNIILKKENNKHKIGIVRDIGYKCIMYPKSINTNAIPYTMGGCIANLLFAAIGIITLLFLPLYPVMWLYTWSFTAFGIGLLFMNGIASIKRVCNDKACYNLLASDKHNKLCHNAQLILAKHLINGLTYGEVGEEIIALCPDIAENDIEAYQAILEYYYYLDIKNYIKMGQALNKIRSKDNISKEVIDIVDMELLYVRLICGINLQAKMNSIKGNCNNASKLHLAIKDAKTFINETEWTYIKRQSKRADVHTYRVKSLYEAYIHFTKGYLAEAVGTLNEAIKSIDNTNYVYEGEMKFCIKQLTEVKNIIESNMKERIDSERFAVNAL